MIADNPQIPAVHFASGRDDKGTAVNRSYLVCESFEN